MPKHGSGINAIEVISATEDADDENLDVDSWIYPTANGGLRNWTAKDFIPVSFISHKLTFVLRFLINSLKLYGSVPCPRHLGFACEGFCVSSSYIINKTLDVFIELQILRSLSFFSVSHFIKTAIL